MLDMKTIIFSYFITNALITLFIALLWYQNRKRYAGLGFWLIDFILQAVGLALLLLRGSVPDLVSIVVGNILIQIGALCIFIGLARFVGKPSSQTHNWVAIGIFGALMAYFAFVQPDITIRTILISAVTILLTGQSGWLMLRRVVPPLRAITRDVGIVFLLYALVALARIVELYALPVPPTSGLFESPPIQVLFILINQMLCIALTFALILMVTRRLELDVQTQSVERTRAEQVLAESQKRFALAFRSLPYAITITRASDGRMLEVNAGFTQITGYSAAECIGKTTLELNLWVDEQDRHRVVAELVKGNPITGMELRFRIKSGAIITGLFSANTFTLGDETCILSSINDITASKRAGEALRASEERFRIIAHFTHDWEYWVGADGRHLYVSPSCARVTGYRAEEFMQDPDLLRALIHPDDRARINSHLRDAFTVRDTAALDFRIITRDGATRWIDHVCVPVYGDDGRWLGRRASNRDVTERKRAESEIEHLASFPRLNPAPVLEFDAAGTITFANPVARDVTACLNVPITAFLPRDLDAIAQALAQKRSDAFQREIVIGERIFEENISLLPDLGVARIYARDITARRQSEELLRARVRLMEYSAIHSLDETLQKTLDEVGVIVNSPIGFFHLVEPDQKTLSLQAWSTRTLDEFCTAQGKGLHYGVDEAGVWVDCVHQRRPVIHNDYASLPHRKGLPEGHAPVIRELVVPILRGGKVIAILGVGNKPTDYDEKDIELVAHFAEVAWEIAERKRAQAALQEYSERLEQMVDERTRELRAAQEQLLQQERLTMLGQIAGGIGHELRTPLGAINNAVYLLRQTLVAPDADAREMLDLLGRQVDASNRIITSLLAFARPQPPVRHPTDVVVVIDAALAQAALPDNIVVQREFDADLPEAQADSDQLQIVFSNLIRNAAQAMPEGGQLTIGVRRLPENSDQFSVFSEQSPVSGELRTPNTEHWILITVRDTGVGIAPETLERIFQPMFTTKTRGLGLGLALCKLLVEGHYGTIRAASQVGVGTTFTIHLPVMQGEQK